MAQLLRLAQGRFLFQPKAVGKLKDVAEAALNAKKARLSNALAEYGEALIFAMQIEIETPKWYVGDFSTKRWGSGTKKIVNAVRDIVDSGTLRDSFELFPVQTGNKEDWVISSSADYINAVRFGYMSKQSKYTPPDEIDPKYKSRWVHGRDFVKSAMKMVPLQSFLSRAKVGGQASIRDMPSPMKYYESINMDPRDAVVPTFDSLDSWFT